MAAHRLVTGFDTATRGSEHIWMSGGDVRRDDVLLIYEFQKLIDPFATQAMTGGRPGSFVVFEEILIVERLVVVVQDARFLEFEIASLLSPCDRGSDVLWDQVRVGNRADVSDRRQCVFARVRATLRRFRLPVKSSFPDIVLLTTVSNTTTKFSPP